MGRKGRNTMRRRAFAMGIASALVALCMGFAHSRTFAQAQMTRVPLV